MCVCRREREENENERKREQREWSVICILFSNAPLTLLFFAFAIFLVSPIFSSSVILYSGLHAGHEPACVAGIVPHRISASSAWFPFYLGVLIRISAHPLFIHRTNYGGQ